MNLNLKTLFRILTTQRTLNFKNIHTINVKNNCQALRIAFINETYPLNTLFCPLLKSPKQKKTVDFQSQEEKQLN